MPAVIEIDSGGAGVRTTNVRGCDGGILNGASVTVPTGNPGSGDIWAEIGILSDRSSTDSVSAVLTSGYVSQSRPLIWEGLASLSPGNGLYLREISLVVNPIRASFRIGSG